MTSPRSKQIEAFLAANGWPEARREMLAEDASFRRYERVSRPDGSAVLMDAPPEKENVDAFLRVARKLGELDFSAPDILGEDLENGFLLLEDFGDQTYTRLLDAGADAGELYALATDVLIGLHRHDVERVVPAGTPDYSDVLMCAEADLFTDWYLPAVTGNETTDAVRSSYRNVWQALLPSARAVPETLVLRDFHVDNLMRLDGKEGIAACGLLDFQDAVRGPVSYDFVSLVEDARRDVDPGLKSTLRARYLAAFPDLDAAAFDLSCAILGAQRHCKVLGIFTRLCDRDQKPAYLVHIPRLWRLLTRSLDHPGLAPLRGWLDANVATDLRIVPPGRNRT